ncbi:hypothetical protein [Aeromonas phage 4L372XY]|uniref:Uncharacterized protein n=1 Tax=Aeromonas phage 4L372XY TaxID=2588520 RepID=A0A5B9N7V0_9CAUD|nr:hypothetical protein HWC28_gp190 [Aeromonas phage 4L372XY]QEG08905.1 hypothetical protein [Aeromonas phage 4L372XY]
MNKNKIYIDVKRTQTIRVEISEEEGWDIPDDMVDFAEFYADIKNDSYSFAKDANWDKPDTEDYEVLKVWIKK